jgi:uncharacterized protein (TIGR03000 family)
MYGLVLMAAMSGGPATPAFHPHAASCSGCTGCTGTVTVVSCHGCTGNHIFGHRASCSGCCGGSWSYASCHGCCGGFLGHHKSCSGCCGGYSCFGSCSGFITQSAWGNCHGCCGGFGYSYGPTTYAYPSYSTPIPTGAAPFYYTSPSSGAAPVVVPPAKTDEEKKDDKKKGASLKFNLPAEAVVFVDGVKAPGQGAERSFATPPLEAGQKYFYDVRAEVVVDGQSIVEEKRVIVEAGAEVRETFAQMIAAVKAASNVAGK